MRYTARVIAYYEVEVEVEHILGVPSAAAAAIRLTVPSSMEIDQIMPAPPHAGELLARLTGKGEG